MLPAQAAQSSRIAKFSAFIIWPLLNNDCIEFVSSVPRKRKPTSVEDFACIIGGTLLIFCAYWLSRLSPPDWSESGEMLDEPQRAIARWTMVQKFVRTTNNILLALVGGAIASAAFVPHGRTWILLWCCILAAVMLCIFLAMLDAVSSLASYRRALPEAARRSFGQEQDDPAP